MSALLTLRSAPSGAPFIGENEGDTILWDATARKWKVGPGGGGGAVDSVFGRTGVVVAATGDYDGDQVDNVSSVPGSSVSDALEYLLANAGAVASVFGRTGVVTAESGDYDSDQVDNESDVDGDSVTEALNALGLGSLLRGADLSGTATNNLTRAGGTLYVMMPNVTDGARVINFLSTGSPAPVYPFTFVAVVYPQPHQVTIVNAASGGAGDTLYTIAANSPAGVFYGQYDNLNFNAAGFGDVEPLP